jgi:glycosyltransferase involved in cell wall biosynthesis
LLATFLAGPAMLMYLWRLIHRARKFKPGFVYSNGIKCHLISLILSRWSNAAVIWHMQDYFPDFSYVRVFMRLIGRQPTLIICNSNSVLEDLRPRLPTSWSTELSTVHNSLDVTNYVKTTGRKASPVVISMVGMITPWKGQDVFVEAVSQLIQGNPDLQISCEIVGDEAYQTHGETGFKSKLQSRVRELGLEGQVRFLGLIRDVESVYKRSHIIAHCSTKPEPFGRVIIEAMASGCAVVGSKAGGVTEIISDSVNGLLIDPGNVEATRVALEKLCSDPLLRERLADKARETVEKNFSAETYAAKIREHLQELS